MRRLRVVWWSGAVAIAGLVAACGGGSGGTAPAAPPVPSTLSLQDLNDFAVGGRGTMLLQLAEIRPVPPTPIKGYETWIPISAFAMAVERDLDIRPGGTSDINLGIAEHSPLSIEKKSDSTSPLLWGTALTGRRILTGSVVLATDIGDDTRVLAETYRIDFEGAFVKDFSQTLNGDDGGADSFSLLVQRLFVTFKTLNALGKPDKTITAGWDFVTQKPWGGPGRAAPSGTVLLWPWR